MNLGIILIFAALASPAPLPSPSAAPVADACGGATTNLLATLNRPTIGFSACAVKPRESLWELGYFNQIQNDGSHAAVYPQGFIRFGASPRLEWDVVGPNYLVQKGGGILQRGFLDGGVGAKCEFFSSPSDTAALDLLYIFPTGSALFTAGAPVETLNFDYGHALSPVAGVATTIGVQSSFAQTLAGRASRFTSLLPSIAFTIQSNPRTQFYAEWYGQTRIRPDGGTLLGVNGGVQYMLRPDLEIDTELGQTVTDLARGHYFGFGIGVRP
ncbi:MAG TPA: hypothetical protein VFW34_10060 [Candidatus Rubrimentiphilum sp.]|nr:hypothetical protein [Candidatus Rubrimentiphilum sp.]